jgi:hypothetical protein
MKYLKNYRIYEAEVQKSIKIDFDSEGIFSFGRKYDYEPNNLGLRIDKIFYDKRSMDAIDSAIDKSKFTKLKFEGDNLLSLMENMEKSQNIKLSYIYANTMKKYLNQSIIDMWYSYSFYLLEDEVVKYKVSFFKFEDDYYLVDVKDLRDGTIYNKLVNSDFYYLDDIWAFEKLLNRL